MADLDFETQLGRLFSDPPHFVDAEAFSGEVRRKLDRGWAIRRMMIGVAGGAAGLVAAAQFVTSRFAGEVQSMSRDIQAVDLGYDRAIARLTEVVSTPASTETLWLAAALAVVALAFAVTRAVEEF